MFFLSFRSSGRNLQPSDTVREVVVNEALLHKHGMESYEEALGKIVHTNGGSMKGSIGGEANPKFKSINVYGATMISVKTTELLKND